MPQTFAATPRPQSSPWGQVDQAEQVAPGIWSVSTPGHGGYQISNERRLAMPAHLKSVPTFAGSYWYEEDCDWCLVALAFPDAFKPGAIDYARKMLYTFDKEPRDDWDRKPYGVEMRKAAQIEREAERAQKYGVQPVRQITKERFWDMLEVLPPCRWVTVAGVEMFHVSERLSEDIVSWFFRVDSRYFECQDEARKPTVELVALVRDFAKQSA